MSGDLLLDVRSLVKRYGDRTVLDGVTLGVSPGEVCGLLGPNGAGKTTLVSIISGLRDPDGGTVLVDGLDVTSAGRAARTRVGLAGQETGVYPTVSVRHNLELFAGLAGLSGRGMAERIDEVCDVVDLGHLLDRPARNLSGGERRRLHTAMALLHRPRILLLDEPTTGVDVGSRSRLLAAVRRLAVEEGCAVVYSTHYLPEIEELDATVVLLDRGRVVARGGRDELIARHGAGSVTITFDGPAPSIDGATSAGSDLWCATDDGAAELARLIGLLGDDATRVVSVDLQRADLGSVFAAVTGRRYRADEADEVEGADDADGEEIA